MYPFRAVGPSEKSGAFTFLRSGPPGRRHDAGRFPPQEKIKVIAR
jgi:hypothetical protein